MNIAIAGYVGLSNGLLSQHNISEVVLKKDKVYTRDVFNSID